jgi:hypothetical protein
MKALAAFLMIAAAMGACAQTDAPTTPLATQLSEMLHRESDGHSPTPDEIETVEALPGLTDAVVAKDLLPLLTKALADPDAHLRAYTLAMLVGMQSLPDAPVPATPASPADGALAPAKPQNPATNAPTGPGAYKSAVASALLPLVPAIGARLTDDAPDNRTLAATVLEGFAPNPPAAVYAPLFDFLKRDDAAGPVGVAVVSALLQFGQPGADTAAAIAGYLVRGDLPADTKASLVEAIAAKPNQSQTVNKVLLGYLDADDAGLRSRLILSLPALDLSADAFAAAKARVAEIVASGQDTLPVVNAAKAVSPCWTQVKMTTGCPVY